MSTKTGRQFLGEQVAACRKSARLSVLELSKKSGTSRQSIYDIEAGQQNVCADQFEKLIRACGSDPEKWWISGLGTDEEFPRQYSDLFHMLKTITASKDDDLINAIRVSLDVVSERAARASPNVASGTLGATRKRGKKLSI